MKNNWDGDEPLPDLCVHQAVAHKCPICNPPRSKVETEDDRRESRRKRDGTAH